MVQQGAVIFDQVAIQFRREAIEMQGYFQEMPGMIIKGTFTAAPGFLRRFNLRDLSLNPCTIASAFAISLAAPGERFVAS